jgi:hypothetical protein
VRALLITRALSATGLAVASRTSVTANAAVIQGWCNTSVADVVL